MILEKYGESFNYDGVSYFIGQRIVATDQSEYKGLRGWILEIRDGDDRDTENETPDIYCEFDPPDSKQEIMELERRFSDLYGEKKVLDDISLDIVIMAPEMISPVPEPKEDICDGQEKNI